MKMLWDSLLPPWGNRWTKSPWGKSWLAYPAPHCKAFSVLRWKSLRRFVGGEGAVVRWRKRFGAVRLAKPVAVGVRAISGLFFCASVKL
ncbi:hypothetical protein ACFX2I_007800 [Malus domestica]